MTTRTEQPTLEEQIQSSIERDTLDSMASNPIYTDASVQTAPWASSGEDILQAMKDAIRDMPPAQPRIEQLVIGEGTEGDICSRLYDAANDASRSFQLVGFHYASEFRPNQIAVVFSDGAVVMVEEPPPEWWVIDPAKWRPWYQRAFDAFVWAFS